MPVSGLSALLTALQCQQAHGCNELVGSSPALLLGYISWILPNLHSNNFDHHRVHRLGSPPITPKVAHRQPALSERRARGRPSGSPEAAQAALRAAAPSQQPGTFCPRAAGTATPSRGPQLGGSGGARSGGGGRGSQQAAVCRGGREAGDTKWRCPLGPSPSGHPPAPRGPASRGANSLPGLARGGGRAGSAAGGGLRKPAGPARRGAPPSPSRWQRGPGAGGGRAIAGRAPGGGGGGAAGRHRPGLPPAAAPRFPSKFGAAWAGGRRRGEAGGPERTCPESLYLQLEPKASRAAFILLIKKTDLGPAAPRRAAALLAPLVPFSSLLSSSSSSSLPPAPWSLRRGREAGNPKALN